MRAHRRVNLVHVPSTGRRHTPRASVWSWGHVVDIPHSLAASRGLRDIDEKSMYPVQVSNSEEGVPSIQVHSVIPNDRQGTLFAHSIGREWDQRSASPRGVYPQPSYVIVSRPMSCIQCQDVCQCWDGNIDLCKVLYIDVIG